MSKKLGNLIKEARTAKGLTQAALAEKVVGITASDVSKIERGEKEPEQEVIKSIAKVLGVTQKSLLEAASGAGKTAAGKAGTSAKTGKTAAKKPAAGKTSAAKAAPETFKLSATEKKLVQLYRKADAGTKKAAINLLEGDSSAVELLGALLASKGSAGKTGDTGSGASDLISSLLSGKTGGSSGSGKDKDSMNALLDLLGKLNK